MQTLAAEDAEDAENQISQGLYLPVLCVLCGESLWRC